MRRAFAILLCVTYRWRGRTHSAAPLRGMRMEAEHTAGCCQPRVSIATSERRGRGHRGGGRGQWCARDPQAAEEFWWDKQNVNVLLEKNYFINERKKHFNRYKNMAFAARAWCPRCGDLIASIKHPLYHLIGLLYVFICMKYVKEHLSLQVSSP